MPPSGRRFSHYFGTFSAARGTRDNSGKAAGKPGWDGDGGRGGVDGTSAAEIRQASSSFP